MLLLQYALLLPLLRLAGQAEGTTRTGRLVRGAARDTAQESVLMKILGISAHYHDSAAALLIDGVPVCAVQEERLSRRKNDAGFPLAGDRVVPRTRRARA